MDETKRKDNHYFRGATPEGIIQTVGIGEGNGEYFTRQGIKFAQKRRYLAVDPKFGDLFDSHPRLQAILAAGVTISKKRIVPTLDELLATEMRVRHFNFDMPDVKFNEFEMNYTKPDVIQTEEKYDFTGIVQRAKRLLLPGGTITIRSEQPGIINRFSELAKEHGFRPGKPKQETIKAAIHRSEYTRQFAKKGVHKLVLVLPPKKALPFSKK